MPTSADSGDSELESESEVIEMSIFGNHSTPSGEVNSLNDANVVETIFDIAEQDSDTINHQLQQVEISSQSEEPKELVPEEPVKTDTHDRSNTTNPDDAEITVIPTEIPCEDNTIKEEVITHQPPPSTLGWIQSVLEKTLIDIKTDIQNLTHEVAGLKNEVSLNANTSSTEQNAIKDRVVRQVAKDLKGMWEQNISATTKISTRINEVVNEFDAAQVKSEALDKSIRKMKADLKSYSNSAFYREDGKLIKEMHSRICPGRILPGEERINNPSPGEPVQTAAEYVKELRNRLTQPNPPVEPIEPVVAPVRRHSDSSVTVPSANFQIESRRSCGYNMTNAAQMQPLPAIILPAIEPLTQPGPPKTQPTPAPADSQDSHRRFTFRTALITDSMMRHIGRMNEGEALGQNHLLEVFNKPNFRGLSHPVLRRKLEHMQPNYIYIHLGVNDIMDSRTPEDVLQDIRGFTAFRDRKIPDAKIMLSLPLRTRKEGPTYMKANEDILRLRTAMKELVNNGCSANQPLKERRLLMNVNTNLGIVGGISLDNCCSDGIHLSSRGRSKILSNFRHHIHEITRQILNKPPRTHSSTSSVNV